jgi:di/tricarboxylate transporter
MIDQILLVIILVIALVLFWTQWVRTDITAVIVMMLLILPWPHSNGEWKGIISYQDGFSGFGSSAVIMVTSMFIFGGAIVKTGAAEFLGVKLFRANADKEWRLQLSILISTTISSMFINDTTVVLIFLPMILAICKEKNLSPSRYLLFLAYGSLLGGQWTLIGTRSNIIISDFFRHRTGQGLGFFDFTPMAVIIFISAAFYFLLLGKKFLPKGRYIQDQQELKEYLTEVVVNEGSSVTGKSINELDWSKRSNLRVIDIIRNNERMPGWVKLKKDDLLIMRGNVDSIGDLLKSPDFQLKEEVKMDPETLQSVDLVTVDALLSPNSNYAGRTLNQVDFSNYYGFTIIGISRHGRTIMDKPSEITLEYGDSLLLIGHIEDLKRLGRNPNLILLGKESFPAIGKRKAAITLLLLLGIIFTSIFDILSPPISIPLAALLSILLGCLKLEDVYSTIDWKTVVTVAAMIPFGIAMEKTQSAELIAKFMVNSFASAGPLLLLAVLFIVTIFLTQLIENAAVAIILAPLAYQLALTVGADPKPFMVGLAISISSSFCTPVAHESTILVMAPGNYKFKHYLVIGAGMAFLTWLGSVFITPLFWPF